jgi:hypothetical protein
MVAPTISTLSGLTVLDGLGAKQQANVGAFTQQKAHNWTASDSDTNIYGRELVFPGGAIDFTTNDRLLLFHIGPQDAATQPRPRDDIGIAVAFQDSSGDWVAFQIDASDTRRVVRSLAGFVLDPNDTTSTLATSGTVDLTDITRVTWFIHGAFGVYLSRVYQLDPFVMTAGSTTVPASIQTVVDYCAGGYLSPVLTQGTKQFLLQGIVEIGDGGTTATRYVEDGVSIEMPTIGDSTAEDISYHGTAGRLGYVLNLGASDVVQISNSVFSSQSAWKWDDTTALGTKSISATAFTNVRMTLNTGTYTSCVITPDTPVDPGSATLSSATLDGASDAALAWNATATVTSSTFSNNNIGIRISTAGTYTFDNLSFSGNTNDVENDSGGAVTINVVNGGDTPTVLNTGAGSATAVQNTVVLSFAGIVSGSQIYIEAASGGPLSVGTEIENATVSTDPHTINYAFTSNQPILYRVRKGISSPFYRALQGTGTIISSGFTTVISQELDE